MESSQTDGATASTRTCPARGTAATVQATSGRLGRSRIEMTLPTMAPTPPIATIVPHAPAPPSSAFATTGPRTIHAQNPRLPMPKRTVEAHSHVRAVNSCPACPQLVEEALLRDPVGSCRNPDAPQDHGADEEAHRIDAKRCPGTPGDDESAAERGAEDAGQIATQPLQRVCLLQSLGTDRLGHEPDLGGNHEAGPMPYIAWKATMARSSRSPRAPRPRSPLARPPG